MNTGFNAQEKWPELFQDLAPDTAKHVVASFASSFHEGWIPNREAVENLTKLAKGEIDKTEYDRRADALTAALGRR